MLNHFFRISKDYCTGCSLCMQICPEQAIQMVYDLEGFLYPKVDTKSCNQCDRCNEVCPIASGNLFKDISIEREVYACQAISVELLIEATAGGLFPVLSEWILSQGGVVIGAAYDSNMKVSHIAAHTMNDIKRFNGSKYVQSDITSAIGLVRNYLENGKVVLFSGTPCQIDAVKRFCCEVKTGTLYTMDVVCYGIPSPKMFRDFLDIVEEKCKKKVTDFRFRDKHKNGWSHTTVIQLKDEDGLTEYLEEEDYTKVPYYKMFGYRDCFRKSCYRCQYNTLNRISDITTGNFWGIETISKAFNCKLGVSMAILNTEQGKKLFQKIQGELISEAHSIEDAIRANEALIRGSKETKRRDAIYRYYINYGFKKMYIKFYSHDWSRALRIQLSKIKQRIVKILRGGGTCNFQAIYAPDL